MPVTERALVLAPPLRCSHLVVGEQRAIQGIENLGGLCTADQHRHRGVPIAEPVLPLQLSEDAPFRVDIGRLRSGHGRQPLSRAGNPQTAAGGFQPHSLVRTIGQPQPPTAAHPGQQQLHRGMQPVGVKRGDQQRSRDGAFALRSPH
jgi:hypothetical protein